MKVGEDIKPSPIAQGALAALLIAAGEGLILAHDRPFSDYYFPFVWFGFALLLDAAVRKQSGRSLLTDAPERILILLPISAAFWWLFELLNVAVNNWIYIGGQRYTGVAFVVFASLDFSTVLPAIWTAAQLVNLLLPTRGIRHVHTARVPSAFLYGMLVAGVLSIVLPVLWPSYFFPLIWGAVYFLLDPINCWLGRPSIVRAVWSGDFRLPIALGLGTLLCGFFWEAWNYWAMPKWIYNIPHVSYLHVFEMPLAGYLGYLPFGLEAFAVTNFVLPLLGFRPLRLRSADVTRRDRDLAA